MKNVILTTGYPLIFLNNTQASPQTTMLGIVNISLENVYEAENALTTLGKDPDTALVFELLGANNLFVNQINLKNVQFTGNNFERKAIIMLF